MRLRRSERFLVGYPPGRGHSGSGARTHGVSDLRGPQRGYLARLGSRTDGSCTAVTGWPVRFGNMSSERNRPRFSAHHRRTREGKGGGSTPERGQWSSVYVGESQSSTSAVLVRIRGWNQPEARSHTLHPRSRPVWHTSDTPGHRPHRPTDVPDRPGNFPTTLNIQPKLHRGVRHHQVAQNAKKPIQNEFFCVFGVFFKFRFLHDCLIWVETPFPTIWKGALEVLLGEASGSSATVIPSKLLC